MYEHRFPLLSAYREGYPIGQAAAALADQMIALYQGGRFREVVALFSNAVPTVPLVLNDGRFAGAAHYNLGLISHRANRFADARRFMELSGLPAGGDFDFLLYHDRLAASEMLAAHQERAISAGKPAILMAALPKSASAFLSVCISEVLGVPVFRSSIGGIPDGMVVGRWAAQINRGGATTHEHYPGSADNIEVLAEAGVRRIFVQIRDPRAAWWSMFHHEKRAPDCGAITRLRQTWYSDAMRWLESWIKASRAPGCPLKVVFVRYDDVRLRPEETIERIFDEVGYRASETEIARYFDSRRQSGRRPENFRVGEPDDWRRGLEPELAAQFWRETAEPVRDLLSMAE